MSEVFVIRNQLGQFWGKKKRWVDGRKRRKVLTFKHQDQGLNQLVELSAKDIELRGEVVPVAVSDSGLPQVKASKHLLQDEEDILAEQADAENAEQAAEEKAEEAAEEKTEE